MSLWMRRDDRIPKQTHRNHKSIKNTLLTKNFQTTGDRVGVPLAVEA